MGSSTVVLIAAAFVALALATTAGGGGGEGEARGTGLHLRAVFASSNGLQAGDAVVVAGLEVGRVTSVRLDRTNFTADVDLTVAAPLAIPTDSRFAIEGGGAGDGLLAIEPGHAATHLASGAVVTATVPAISLEQQVGNYIFGNGGLGGD